MKTLIGAVAMAALAASSVVASEYDGSWTVAITAEEEHCQRSDLAVVIAGGEVSYDGLFGVEVDGAVAPGGELKLQLAHGEDVVHAFGRLQSASGGGEWRSATLGCAGTWTAARK